MATLKRVLSLKKGDHWFRPLFLKTLKNGTKVIKFSFDESMKSPSPYVNKLFGISSTFDPHNRSIRIGWMYEVENDRFMLLPYTYQDGIRYINIHGTDENGKGQRVYVKAGEEITVTLSDFMSDAGRHTFGIRMEVDKNRMFEVNFFRKSSGKKAFLPAILTHPYYGGPFPSTQDMLFVATEGLKKAMWIRTLNSVFTSSPALTSISIGIILFTLMIILGNISPVVLLLIVLTPILIWSIFIDQWLYVGVSKLLRRFKRND